ncbi:MAG: hemerythrin domain-containing protein [Pseudomonadota bacterium]
MHELLDSAAPGFDAPLQMLRACHGRITAQCTTLQRLHQHLQAQGNDAQAVQAARAILRYFDMAGRFHHQDEEQDLFPLLRASGSPQAAEYIDRLLQEHRTLDEAWQDLRPLLVAIAEHHAHALDGAVVERFNHGYAQHIAFENAHLLPLAERVLDAAQLQQLGRSMAARRGVAI